MEVLIFLIIVIGLGVFLIIYTINLNTIKIQKHERIAVFRGTQFIKIIGPGKHYQYPYNLVYWFKIKIDKEGIYQKDNIVKFGEFEIPVEVIDVLQNGDNIFIKSFDNEKITIEKINAQRIRIDCESEAIHDLIPG